METTIIKFTNSQEAALKNIMDWLRMEYDRTDKKTQTAILTGSAGTGKTFLLKEIINRFGSYGVSLAAPNHRAAAQIQESVGIEAVTDHKLMGLRPNLELNEFDPMNPSFGKKGNSVFDDYTVYLVIQDEASMLPPVFQDMLEEECYKRKIKLLYVGDHLQLPPIIKEKGKYSNELKLSNTFNGPNKTVLTDIVRQDMDNPGLFLLSAVRYEMEPTEENIDFLNAVANTLGGKFIAAANNVKKDPVNVLNKIVRAIQAKRLIIPNTEEKETGKLVILDDDDKKRRYIQEYFNRDVYDPTISRFIAHTNKSVKDINDHCNVRINGYSPYDNFHVNDFITGYRTVMRSNEKIMVNSVDYQILKVSEEVTNSHGLKGKYIEAAPINANFVPTQFFSINTDQYAIYWNTLQRYLEEAKNGRAGRWGKYYGYRDSNFTSRDIMQGNVKLDGKDFDLGFAITVNKSQGMTIKNSFVKLTEILNFPNTEIRNRLAYVALSRGKNNFLLL